MDKFKKLIENQFRGFTLDSSRDIIRKSSEVSDYVNKNIGHFNYVQQLMNDRIIDEAMGRVLDKGDFEFDREKGFVYKQHTSRQNINEAYPQQPYYPQQQSYQQQNGYNNVMARLDAMENEMNALRMENEELKRKYGRLK
jgi:hypothetical protein